MKTTDYSKIANKYESNKYRVEEVRFDSDIKAYIEGNPKSKYDFLDLACGTGIYIDKQVNHYKDYNIDWYGLDASEDMLKIAKGKLNNVAFTKAFAEDMPYEYDNFDFITNNYAFHHFTNKALALDEIYRVLKSGGIYKVHNIAIHDMTEWWVYQYFPTAYYEDLKRFGPKEVIFNELQMRGFQINIHIEYRIESRLVADYLGYAENRDITILTLINDREYQEGLDKMRYDVRNNPNKT